VDREASAWEREGVVVRAGRWQLNREPAAASAAVALGVDRTSMCLDDGARDREADPETAEPPVYGRLLLPETLEDERQERGFDAVPRVLDDELDSAVVAPRRAEDDVL